MKPMEQCPVCGGALATKLVDKVLSGGGNTVSMKVSAEVCSKCGEQLYPTKLVQSFDEIRRKLRDQEFSHLRQTGRSFTIEEGWLDQTIRPAG